MSVHEETPDQLRQEVEQLRARLAEQGLRLAEAEETLEAIREGAVDALVVAAPEGNRVFTLQGADQAYQTIIEQMQEGAVTLVEDGHINYCNRRFAEMVRRPMEEIIGSRFCEHLIEPDRGGVQRLVRQTLGQAARAELTLQAADGTLIPIQVGLGVVVHDGTSSISMVVTDLTEHKRAEQILAGERFVRSILNQAADGIVVCDLARRVTFANAAACRLAGFDPTGMGLEDVMRAWGEALYPDGRPIPVNEWSLLDTLSGKVCLGQESRLLRADGRHCDLLASSRPLRDTDDAVIGAVATFTDISQRKRAEEETRRHVEELRSSNEELARFNAAMVDRELRMIELKKEVNALCARLSEPGRYPLDFTEERP
jgi:PAS domain S-box-containing protein